MKVFLLRLHSSAVQTQGIMFVVDDYGNEVFSCKTLELPWLNNAVGVSSVPPLEYKVVKRFSPRFQYHYHVQDVVKRDYILIHAGNFNTDTHGCILVGSAFRDINNDGVFDLIESKITLSKLLAVCGNSFNLKIS